MLKILIIVITFTQFACGSQVTKNSSAVQGDHRSSKLEGLEKSYLQQLEPSEIGLPKSLKYVSYVPSLGEGHILNKVNFEKNHEQNLVTYSGPANLTLAFSLPVLIDLSKASKDFYSELCENIEYQESLKIKDLQLADGSYFICIRFSEGTKTFTSPGPQFVIDLHAPDAKALALEGHTQKQNTLFLDIYVDKSSDVAGYSLAICIESCQAGCQQITGDMQKELQTFEVNEFGKYSLCYQITDQHENVSPWYLAKEIDIVAADDSDFATNLTDLSNLEFSVNLSATMLYADAELVCEAHGLDAANENIALDFIWSIDNGASWSFNGAILEAKNFSKGNQVVCKVTATSGDLIPTVRQSETLLVQDSPPPMPSLVVIEPSDLATATEAVCVASGAIDADGDAVTYVYEWSLDGGASWDLQGSKLSASAFNRDSQLLCRAFSLAANVMSPAQSSTLRVVDSNPPTAPTSVTVSPSVLTKASTASCTASGSSDADGNAVTYSYEWSTDLVSWASGENTLSLASFNKGASLYCRARARSVGVYSDYLSSAAYTISDSSPSQATSVTISPNLIYKTSSPSCLASGSIDVDGDSISYTYEWNINNGSWGFTGNSLSAANFQKGDIIRCRASAIAAGQSSSVVISSGLNVSNSAPTEPSTVSISAISNESAQITCSHTGGSTDADGDAITYYLVLQKQEAGSWIDVLTNTSGNFPITNHTLDNSSGEDVSVGDVFRCQAYAYDGSSNSSEISSSETAVGYILDVYVSNLKSVFSLRKLVSGYSGYAIKINNGSATADISYTSSGALDTSAISTFCGSNVCTVATWYDQKGNFDLSQATQANQPTIWDGSQMHTLKGKPSVKFDGNDSLTRSNGPLYNSTTAAGYDDVTAFTVWNRTSSSGSQVIWEQNAASVLTGRRFCLITLDSSVYGFNGENNDAHDIAAYAVNTPYYSTVILSSTSFADAGSNSNNVHVFTNGVDDSSNKNINLSTQNTANSFFAMGRKTNSSEFLQGYISEVILYTEAMHGAKAADRQDVENSVKTYYGF